MKTLVAYVVGIAAASTALALLVAPVLSFLPTPVRFAANFGIAFALTAVALGAVVLALRRLHALRLLWLGVAGYAVGFFLYGGFLASTRSDPFAVPLSMPQLLAAAALGGGVGWLCGALCWSTARYLMRPNTSLERTRER